jgi:hypothetical protein
MQGADLPFFRRPKTITDAMLGRVFGVAQAADHIPSGIPFILSHAACKVRRDE